MNGWNDAANSIATVVSTRVLTPRLAVLWAAFFNFAAAFLFGLHVAATIGKGTVDPGIVDNAVVGGTLVGGILWSWACTHYGLPISVSHSLIGGLAGAAVTKGGWYVLQAAGFKKILLFIVLSPAFGLIAAFFLMIGFLWGFRRAHPARVDRLFRRLQLISAAAFSLSHGSNDAQKTMGIIVLILYSNRALTGHADPGHVPLWVLLSCHAAIALGTAAGGWKVVRTLGTRVTALRPIGGCSAETGAAITLFATAALGIPVSTTHTITGALVGVGATRRLSAVRWGVARRIVWAWILTIPVSAAVGALSFLVLRAAGLK
ncbi:MAG TPA: inorganic phosphate transporter [Planctomycetota bacterium]|nr:inorganic phosphate transporter [Planctomycetota bacterium]